MRRASARLGLGLVLFGLMGLLAVVGLGFCLWAGYQWLDDLWGSAPAAFFIGLVALGLAGVSGWLAWRFSR